MKNWNKIPSVLIARSTSLTFSRVSFSICRFVSWTCFLHFFSDISLSLEKSCAFDPPNIASQLWICCARFLSFDLANFIYLFVRSHCIRAVWWCPKPMTIIFLDFLQLGLGLDDFAVFDFIRRFQSQFFHWHYRSVDLLTSRVIIKIALFCRQWHGQASKQCDLLQSLRLVMSFKMWNPRWMEYWKLTDM